MFPNAYIVEERNVLRIIGLAEESLFFDSIRFPCIAAISCTPRGMRFRLFVLMVLPQKHSGFALSADISLERELGVRKSSGRISSRFSTRAMHFLRIISISERRISYRYRDIIHLGRMSFRPLPIPRNTHNA